MSCRMQRSIGMGLLCLLVNAQALASSKITRVDFVGTQDPSEIEIQADGPFTYQKEDSPGDKQIVLELKGVSISDTYARKIDTSAFNSKVSEVSPYQVKGQDDTVRVVIQLRDLATAEFKQDGNTLKVMIPNQGTTSPSVSSKSTSSESSPPSDTPGASLDEATSPSPAPLPSGEGLASSAPVDPASQEAKPKLLEFMDSKVTQRFTGKPVTLQVRDADVADILRLIGAASGFNIVIGDDVKGKLTLSLVDVPWDQALDVVLHTLHLGAERNNNILRVVTLQNLTAEKIEELKATRAAEGAAPRVTRVFPISYANPTELQAILEKFSSSSGSGSVAGGAGGPGLGLGLSSPGEQGAIVQVDNRTNSLIVRDLPDNIERMKKLIEILDTQTPQVMIEAKVIEAQEGFSKSLAGSLGLGGVGDVPFFGSFAGGNPIDSLLGSAGVFPTGTDVHNASSPTTGTKNGTFGISPSLSFIPGFSRLNALLSWGEGESQVKIVSSPKTVVMNKQKATIVEGTPVLVPGTTTVAGVGTVPADTVKSANVSLDVRPTVTNEASVLMELNVTKDIPLGLPGGQQGIGTRNLTTTVLVDSGSTLVIGGIYTMQENHSSEGFPFLRKIPILGALFGSSSDSTQRSELFIFITPRVLNSKEAGLTG